MKPNYVYVASSWRNEIQPVICEALRSADVDHYDFKNPGPSGGFHWSEVMPGYTTDNNNSTGPGRAGLGDVDPHLYLEALQHERAIEGFESDFAAMHKADTCILILPCNRSAHLELGWAVGAGKRTAILLDGPLVTPELMYKMVDYIAPDMLSLLQWVVDCAPPSTLGQACVEVMESATEPMDASMILGAIRARWGQHAFHLCTILDVCDEMEAVYGKGRA